MEQRRFCAKCNAPEIKNSGVCVVCGGTDFVLPQTEEPVKVVEIEDAVVKASVDSKFIKASPDEGVVENVSEKENVSAEPQPVEEKEPIQSSEEAMPIQPKKRPTNIIPGEGRTIVYKSFAEYEKELAEKEALEGPEEKDKKNKPKKEPKKASFVIMSIILCLVLVAGGFALGVYLTHNGFLDGILHSEQIGINEAQQAEIDAQKARVEAALSDIGTKLVTVSATEAIMNDEFNAAEAQLLAAEMQLAAGQLLLEDPENPLTCGIEIRVQPPGKQVKTITLLSGGEKAFVAIALYFAILKVRPTPFCMLDEIDAALDDRNVERFASYLHNLSKKTQFIVITHRRGTMEIGDRLYGVTMPQRGISQAIELNVNEIEGRQEEILDGLL
mgnify:CR=1 FL=1